MKVHQFALIEPPTWAPRSPADTVQLPSSHASRDKASINFSLSVDLGMATPWYMLKPHMPDGKVISRLPIHFIISKY